MEKLPASDFEVALFLSRHIDNPCLVDIEGNRHNIRDFYLREAERILPEIKDYLAHEILLRKLAQYQSIESSQ